MKTIYLKLIQYCKGEQIVGHMILLQMKWLRLLKIHLINSRISKQTIFRSNKLPLDQLLININRIHSLSQVVDQKLQSHSNQLKSRQTGVNRFNIIRIHMPSLMNLRTVNKQMLYQMMHKTIRKVPMLKALVLEVSYPSLCSIDLQLYICLQLY